MEIPLSSEDQCHISSAFRRYYFKFAQEEMVMVGGVLRGGYWGLKPRPFEMPTPSP